MERRKRSLFGLGKNKGAQTGHALIASESPRRILLTPGPCQTSETVRLAAAREDLNHRDPEFLQIQYRIKESLTRLAPGYTPYLIGGSGTAAMEALVTSLPVSGPILILADGYYAERMVDLFQIHRIPHDVLGFEWLQGWDLEQVESALKSKPYEAVVATHHETTTGRKNPVENLAPLTARYNAKLWVDAMSSFGADHLPLEGVDAIVASANKCLHGLPGVSFVLTREPVASLPQGPRTYYLDLTRYQGETPPLTAPVPTMAAFDQALYEFHAEGGQPARYRNYLQKALLLRTTLESCDLQLPVHETQASVTLVMASLPPGFESDLWFDWNYARGFVIYRCKPPLDQTYFQVSTMGETTQADIHHWLNTIQED